MLFRQLVIIFFFQLKEDGVTHQRGTGSNWLLFYNNSIIFEINKNWSIIIHVCHINDEMSSTLNKYKTGESMSCLTV